MASFTDTKDIQSGHHQERKIQRGRIKDEFIHKTVSEDKLTDILLEKSHIDLKIFLRICTKKVVLSLICSTSVVTLLCDCNMFCGKQLIMHFVLLGLIIGPLVVSITTVNSLNKINYLLPHCWQMR